MTIAPALAGVVALGVATLGGGATEGSPLMGPDVGAAAAGVSVLAANLASGAADSSAASSPSLAILLDLDLIPTT